MGGDRDRDRGRLPWWLFLALAAVVCLLICTGAVHLVNWLFDRPFAWADVWRLTPTMLAIAVITEWKLRRRADQAG